MNSPPQPLPDYLPAPRRRADPDGHRASPAADHAGIGAEGRTGARVPAVELRGAHMRFGERPLWEGLNLAIERGEFVAVLGPNGSGKTTLLKVLLGQRALSAGEVRVSGGPPGGRGARIGYVPQQRAMDPDLPLRARDLIGLGLDGHRFGPRLGGRATRRRRAELVDAALAAVDATGFADTAVGRLSGGEQQRVRVAQSLVGDPAVLLCDEPLLSLDLANQRAVSELINRRRLAAGTAVVFVTHEINPIQSMVDRVLYLVDGRFRIGTPAQVMTSAVLSELYRTEVEVLRIGDRLVVIGADDACCHPDAAGDSV